MAGRRAGAGPVVPEEGDEGLGGGALPAAQPAQLLHVVEIAGVLLARQLGRLRDGKVLVPPDGEGLHLAQVGIEGRNLGRGPPDADGHGSAELAAEMVEIGLALAEEPLGAVAAQLGGAVGAGIGLGVAELAEALGALGMEGGQHLAGGGGDGRAGIEAVGGGLGEVRLVGLPDGIDGVEDGGVEDGEPPGGEGRRGLDGADGVERLVVPGEDEIEPALLDAGRLLGGIGLEEGEESDGKHGKSPGRPLADAHESLYASRGQRCAREWDREGSEGVKRGGGYGLGGMCGLIGLGVEASAMGYPERSRPLPAPGGRSCIRPSLLSASAGLRSRLRFPPHGN